MRIVHLVSTKLDNFVSRQNLAQFTQSWQWSVLQKSLSGKTYCLGVVVDKKIVASISLFVKKVGNFKYLYSPRGPVIASEADQTGALNFLIKEIRLIAKKERARFWRWEPTFALPINHWPLVKTVDLQPALSLVVNLQSSTDELLTAMHQKTRYNIRLAIKKGIQVTAMTSTEWPTVWQIFKQTKERDGFSLHDQAYYQAMLQQPMLHCLVAKYEEKIISAMIVCHFGDTATYVHGASANIHREVMAPYLLQWTAIQQAKKAGLQYYDFFGIDEKKWPGVTRFKQGFGGLEITYAGTYDLIFSKFYYTLYKQLRKLRRLF